MYIKSISELLSDRPMFSIDATRTVGEACMILSTRNIGALPVVENGRLVGILSERDVIRRCVIGGRDTSTTLVSEVMTREPVTLGPEDSPASAMDIMLAGQFRHLPVCDAGNKLIGMISMRDIPTENRLLVERFRDYSGMQAVYG
ncbi:CBS domain-containing protein [Poseidonocella pacifica]|uniref:CBS domain-containing protein n=1 Tax=Poseidonocella pacifica TaxID=871651 RepID=A0A1I0WKJ9_9RHOB|nr:CBS domain-containing protein [Poseidonocella pacifica]SFA89064.1 CBS domain-containing protein [Poseidonocella pacifica]